MFNLRHPKRKLLAMLSVLLCTQACINMEDFDPDRLAGVKASSSVAVPLMYGSLTIGDLLPLVDPEYVEVDQDQLVHITFSDTLVSTSIHDYFLLPPIYYKNQYATALLNLLPGNQQVVFDEQVELDFGFPEADFETVKLKSGQLLLNISSQLGSEVELVLTIPTAEKDGEALTIKLVLPANNNSQRTAEVNLKDFVLDLSGYERGENLLPIHIQGKIDSGNSDQISSADYVDVELELSNLSYHLLTGYFGQPQINLDQKEIFLSDAFEQIFSKGKFGLKNPSLSFDILNSNGVSVQAIVNSLKARTSTGETLDIQIDPASPFIIAHPTVFGQRAKTTLNITNVAEILDLAPSFIDYQISGALNPGQPMNLNFLTDSSKTSVVLHADVPLWGYLEGLTLSETLPFSLPMEVTEVDVEEVSMRVMIENEFPLGADVQVYFVNALNQPIDSLFDQNSSFLIRPSTVTASGDLQSANKYTLDIPFSGERFEKIMKAENIIVKGLLYTSRNPDGSQPNVKIKANQQLNIQIGVRADNMNIILENPL